MATRNSKANGATGTALAPATFAGSRGLALVASGAVQQVAYLDACRSKAGGVTLDEARTRLLAAHAPLWARTANAGDFGYMAGKGAGSKAASVLHVYRHAAPKGSPVVCEASHGIGGRDCKATAKSVGDGATRYATGDNWPVPAFDASAATTLDAANAWLGECVASLAARGASVPDMLATGSLAWYAAASPAFARTIAGAKATVAKPKATAKAATPAKASKPRTAKAVAPVE